MEEMGQEGQNTGLDSQMESVGLKDRSAAGKIDLRRLCLTISAPLPIQFYTQSLSTHCVSQLTHVFSFNSFW